MSILKHPGPGGGATGGGCGGETPYAHRYFQYNLLCQDTENLLCQDGHFLGGGVCISLVGKQPKSVNIQLVIWIYDEIRGKKMFAGLLISLNQKSLCQG